MARERFPNALGAIVTYGVYREGCRAELWGMAQLRYPAATVMAVARSTARNISSMAQDLAKCRPTEVDFINGAVVKYGENSAEAQPKTRGAGLGRFHEPRPRGQWRRGEGVSPQAGNPRPRGGS